MEVSVWRSADPGGVPEGRFQTFSVPVQESQTILDGGTGGLRRVRAMMVRPHRRHPLWLAFLLHRVSGLLLALFLPVHFLVLATALTGEAALDGFLHWTDSLAVKIAEFGLVFLLAVHLFGGLRLLALELLPWSPRHKAYAAGAAALAFLVSGTFLLSAV